LSCQMALSRNIVDWASRLGPVDVYQEIAPRWIGSCALHPTSPDDLRDDARVEVEVVNTVLMVSKR
jgi:hypothetical protein